MGYRLWSSSFIQPKVDAIRHLLREAGMMSGSLLDIGCGPGSNATFFGESFEYTGVDINPDYIDYARQTYPGMRFHVSDATQMEVDHARHDVILINSLLHHLDDSDTAALLKATTQLIAKGGVVILQEPLVPSSSDWTARLMMTLDRGKHFRALDHWQALYKEAGHRVVRDAFYTIRMLGRPAWRMHSVMLSPCNDCSGGSE